ncbi:MAG: NUDIX hydrolase [Sporomusaceae bacterium]|nr:NUDIX hydrolase [Sporomusaceae bacterium]
MELKETMLLSEQVFSGSIITVCQDQIELPNGRKTKRDVVLHPGAAAIVPVTKAGKLVLVRQYRYPVQTVLLEIPAGKLDQGESPEVCARRELEEETGFQAGTLTKLTAIYTAPGFSNEIIHIYLAQELTKTKQQLDSDEFLNVEEYSREQVQAMIRSGEICDAKSITGIMLAESLLR